MRKPRMCGRRAVGAQELTSRSITRGSHLVVAGTSHIPGGRVTDGNWRVDAYRGHNAMNPGAVLGAQQGSNEQMIRFDHVSKVYKRGARPALDDVDIKVNRDEFVFLVGASGSGKSTFLRLVLREERPTKGRIHVLGRDLSQISSWKVPQLRREIGFGLPGLPAPGEQERAGERGSGLSGHW